jgi:hypothetical protein
VLKRRAGINVVKIKYGLKGILILLITLYPDIKIIIECITPRKHPKIYSLKIPKSKHMVPVR